MMLCRFVTNTTGGLRAQRRSVLFSSHHGLDLLVLGLAAFWAVGAGCSGPAPVSTPETPVSTPETPAATTAAETGTPGASAGGTVAANAGGTASSKTSGGSSPSDGEWGTLKGRFVYDGQAPTPKKLKVTQNPEHCTKHHPVDESLVVAEDGSLANVVVYIRKKRGNKLVVHPDYQPTEKDNVVVDNKFCRFEPHLTLLRTSQTLIIKNSDPVAHNTKADFFTNSRYSFNRQIPAGEEFEVKVPEDEGRPMPIGCNIHPWMTGYLLVRDDPYMAGSDKEGKFEIKNIPVGEHEFQFWQEKSGHLKNITFTDGKANKRGRAKIQVVSGVTDLGEIKVSPKMFE